MDEYYKTNEGGIHSHGTVDYSIAPAMRMVDWLVVLIISIIPVANIIVMLIWSFSGTENPNRRSFAQAFLLLFGLEVLVLAIFIGQVAGLAMKAMAMFG